VTDEANTYSDYNSADLFTEKGTFGGKPQWQIIGKPPLKWLLRYWWRNRK
jgi:hypothetical protein